MIPKQQLFFSIHFIDKYIYIGVGPTGDQVRRLKIVTGDEKENENTSHFIVQEMAASTSNFVMMEPALPVLSKHRQLY